jgi:dolichol-phosphate mannosyltransferase
MISIVLPTYNEGRNIQEVLRRASEALRNAREDHELIVVDDSSPDHTADLAEALANEIPVRVLRRPGRGGLATAVVAGWSIARGDVLGVMDADLQHPPEVLTRLVSALRNHNADVAIATRSGLGGGSAEEWSLMRRLTSWAARHLAACVLPRTLAEVSDPMSGMFLIRARALEGVPLEPTGYKILLEVLGKAHYGDLVEVPFMFQARSTGSSKLGMRESLQYLAHLARLARSTGQLRSWIRYATVGFTGAVVNVAALTFLAERRAWPVGAALPIAILLALTNNFFWNWLFTFRASRAPGVGSRIGVLRRLAHYGKVCATGGALNASLTLLLNWRGVQLPLASAAGVMLGGAWNLFFNVPAIWRSWDSPAPHRQGPVWDESGN